MAPHQKDRLLVVIGSGPGIGVHVASAFATRGFNRVALVARNQAKLNSDRATIEKAAAAGASVKVGTYATDITDHVAFNNILNRMDEEMGPAECVFYNAATVRPSVLLETSEVDMEQDFKVRSSPGMRYDPKYMPEEAECVKFRATGYVHKPPRNGQALCPAAHQARRDGPFRSALPSHHELRAHTPARPGIIRPFHDQGGPAQHGAVYGANVWPKRRARRPCDRLRRRRPREEAVEPGIHR